MSEFNVIVVQLGKIGKHPNADSLSITHVVGDYPVIFRTGDFQEGDLAAYIPVDSVVPESPEWDFLKGHRRIKAKKLRGIFSMGLLTKPPVGSALHQNVQVELGIEKYEPEAHFYSSGEQEKDPGFIPVYTDIEGFRKYKDLFSEGEEVVISEKIHGANGRFCYNQDRLWCGSHKQIKKQGDTIWWIAAHQENLHEKFKQAPGIVFYGEVYGKVQDLRYDLDKSISLAFFDAYSIANGRYLNFVDFEKLIKDLELKTVPILHRGPWSQSLTELRNGKSTIASHVREGIVIKSAKEQFCERTAGRKILKFIGEDYMLRKEPDGDSELEKLKITIKPEPRSP